MSTNTLKTRIRHAYKTEAEWASSNPVLLAGEEVYSSDNNKKKIGNGTSKWSELSYVIPSKSDIGLGNVPNVATNDQTPTFSQASSRANIASGEKLSVIFGKVMKWFADLKTVAFTGSYNDLSNKPTIPTVGNGTVTIKQAGASKGTFTMNQSGNTTIELTDNNTTYSSKSAASGGTDVSLVTTGEKYSWNNKANASHGNHVPATQTANNAVFLRNDNTWQTVTPANIGAAAASHGTHIPSTCTTITDWNNATTNGWYMASNASNQPVSNGGWFYGIAIVHNSNYIRQIAWHFATDANVAGTNCDRYERAKHNGTWGSWVNTSVRVAVPSNAKFTDTWRGIQDNLTSTSTTESLSANQGKVLKGLVDGKAASSHTHSAYVNQNAFSNVVVGSTTVAADTATDTLTLVAGSNVTITPDATNDKITIASKDTVYTHPTYTSKPSGLYKVTVDGTGHVSATAAVTKADITALGIPSSDTDTHYTSHLYVGASGGNANATSATSNPYLLCVDNTTNRNSVQLKAGSNMSISAVNGVVTFTATDTNTWRGIQNNLTSDSTTDSLSAAQGKALKTLIDSKTSSTQILYQDSEPTSSLAVGMVWIG